MLMLRRRRRIQGELAALKLATGCARCSTAIDDPERLHFHHIDPASKAFKISQAPTRSADAVAAELEKCIVLCFDCHMQEHQLAETLS